MDSYLEEFIKKNSNFLKLGRIFNPDTQKPHKMNIFNSFIVDKKRDDKDFIQYSNNALKLYKELYGLNYKDNKIHILNVTGALAGCEYLRAILPSKYLNRESDIVSIYSSQVTPELLAWSDIIIICRIYNENFHNIWVNQKKLGKVVIYDIDDNLHEVPVSNPAYSTYNKKNKSLSNIIKIMNIVDYVTVTNDRLANYYAKLIDDPKKIKVFKNCLDLEKTRGINKEFKYKDKIRIGWSGSHTHYEDLLIINDALIKLKKKYKEQLEIVLYGWDGLIRKMTIDKENKKLSTKFDGGVLLNIDKEFNSFTSYEEYLHKLEDLDLDIAVIPLKKNIFNIDGKSNLKFLDFASCKVPCIVSDIPTYTDTVTHNENALIAKNTTEDWIEKIELLMNDYELRKRIGTNGYKLVNDKFNLAKEIHDRANFYRKNADILNRLIGVKKKIVKKLNFKPLKK